MRRKYVIPLVAVCAAFLAWRLVALIASRGDGQSGRGGRPAVAVEVDSVRFGLIRDVRLLTGTVVPHYQYVIAPKISGRLVTLAPRIGDWVDSGEIVGLLEDAEYEQGVIEAEANLNIARASLAEVGIQFELAHQEKDQVETLQAKGIASPSELDAAVSNHAALAARLDLAKAQVQQREAALQSAKIRRSYTRLAASRSGFIGERFVDAGALLAPNTSVLSVVAIDSVLVRATIIERDYGSIRAGQRAEVMVDAFPSRRFAGVVARVAPQLQEASRVAQVEVGVANDSLLLKPGMFARVEVVIEEKEHAQVAPTRALVTRNGQRGLFVVAAQASEARYVPAITGIQTPTQTEILSPTIEGVVVTLGQHLLEDGSEVLSPKADSARLQAQGAGPGKTKSR
ncbi:MAG: efflux RND transporter periplasmic adaptor subunit [Candidatus Eisenbacteria bacterium]|nr:efflux RND transporter periplasmic adaptor subunit [Candidatus Eisenbacteria bacterium]